MVHTANLHSLGSKLLARYKKGKSFKVNKTCKMHKIRHHEGGLLSQELKCYFWGGPMLGCYRFQWWPIWRCGFKYCFGVKWNLFQDATWPLIFLIHGKWINKFNQFVQGTNFCHHKVFYKLTKMAKCEWPGHFWEKNGKSHSHTSQMTLE